MSETRKKITFLWCRLLSPDLPNSFDVEEYVRHAIHLYGWEDFHVLFFKAQLNFFVTHFLREQGPAGSLRCLN